MNLELGCSFIVHRVWYSLGSPGVHTRDQWPFNLKLPQGCLWRSSQHTPQIEPRSGKRVNFCVWISFSQMCISLTFWLHSYLTARVCWHLPTLNVITDREFCFYSFGKMKKYQMTFFLLTLHHVVNNITRQTAIDYWALSGKLVFCSMWYVHCMIKNIVHLALSQLISFDGVFGNQSNKSQKGG